MSNIFQNVIDKFRAEKVGDTFFYTSDGSSYDAFSDNMILKDFKEIPELNSVINWKASAFRNAKFVIVNDKGEFVKDFDLFKNPNYFQGEGEFLRQTKLFHEIFGNEYLYFLSGINSKNYEKINGVYTLPPNLVEIDIKNAGPFWTTTEAPTAIYTVTWDGKNVPLELENVIHLNDNRVDFTSEDYLKGTSKVESLKVPLNNIRAAYQARGTNLTEMGPRGILSNASTDGVGSTIPLDPKQKDDLHKQMKGHGAGKGQKRSIITNLSLSWQAMGYDTSNLKAFEEVETDFNIICDAFGVSADLFSRQKNSTFENKTQAGKAAYQDTIIPETEEWVDALNNHFEMQGNKIGVMFDHLAIFQNDKDAAASAMLKATSGLSKAFIDGAITIEEYKEQLNLYLL